MRRTPLLCLALLLTFSLAAAPAAAGPLEWLGQLFKNPFAVAPCGGFQLLSATPISVTSTENLSGQYITLQIIANCAGESATLIQRDQLSSFLKLPVGTEIQIGLQSTTETNTYPILNEGIPVYSYASQYAQCAQLSGSGCNVWSNYQYSPSPTYTWQTACGSVAFLTRNRIGTLGSLGAPASRASAMLTVTVGDKTTQTKVGSQDPSVILKTADGEEVGTATWLGSLVSGQALPSESNYGAFYDEAKKAWKVTTSAEKDTYRTSQATATAALAAVPTAGFCLGQLYSPNDAIATSGLTSAAAVALRDSTATLGTSPIHNTDSLTTATVPLEVVGLINKPIILLTIRADLLGITIPASKPVIKSATLPPLGVGEFGSLTVQVGNDGTQQGGIAVSATCGNLLVAPGQTVTVQPGQVVPVSLQVSGSVAQSGSCEVRACDVAGAGCATATTAFTLTPTKLCIPGEVKPDVVSGSMGLLSASGGVPLYGTTLTAGEIILTKCSADGMNVSVALACGAGALVYEPSAKPYPWACSEVAACGASVEVLEVTSLYSATPTYGATTPTIANRYTFLDQPSGCTYACEKVFGSGTGSAPIGERTYLLGCGDVSAKVAAIKQTKSIPPPATPPPAKNQTGASTAGMCKLDSDCRYEGEKCVTGACQPSGGKGLPGFEAVFAVAGLLLVAWRVNRKQRGR